MSGSGGALRADFGNLTREQRMWRWRILISTYFAYAGYYLTRKVFAICKTSLSAEFHVDLPVIAHIWTAYLIAYMVGQFINSFLGRKYGPRALLLGGLGGSILVNVYFGFSNSYWTFLTFMAFNGLLQASGWPGAVGGVSQWLRPRERGSIMGVWSTNYLVGDILVKSIGSVLLESYGWRYAFFGCTLLAALVWCLVYFWQRNKPEDVGLAPIVDPEGGALRAVKASNEENVTFREYLRLLVNPIVPLMGLSYLFVKFLRYALDSWLPTFLDLQGMSEGAAAQYSMFFNFAGLAGALLAGWALDRIFRGNWAALCFVMGLGMVGGYASVILYGGSPVAQAAIFGLVGFMMYGPDTILAGAASVTVAGERNGVAMAGLVNGIASIGPIIQEEVIGHFMHIDKDLTQRAADAVGSLAGVIDGSLVGQMRCAATEAVTTIQQRIAITNTNYLGFGLSILFVVLTVFVFFGVRSAHRRNHAA